MLKSSFGLLLNPSISRSFDSNNLSFLLRIAKGSKSFSLGLFNIELSILKESKNLLFIPNVNGGYKM